jgi:hypothetical protein
MKVGILDLTSKGQRAIDDYRMGRYSEANISELQFGLLAYAGNINGMNVFDSLKQYGTEGTAALEQLIEEGKLKWR